MHHGYSLVAWFIKVNDEYDMVVTYYDTWGERYYDTWGEIWEDM